MERNGIHGLHFSMLIMLSCFATCNANKSDLSCLRSIKESLKGPSDTLSEWDMSEDFCDFPGVQCWVDKHRVHTIQLSDMKLTGPFPIGLLSCTIMQILDLSSNYLSGTIPSTIGDALPYIVSLDLSNNNLSGPVPHSIVNWRYLNAVRLDNNRLTGQLPQDLTLLNRIKVFNVTNNRLSGHVPTFRTSYNFSAECYANNSGLCGGPLKACKDEDHDSLFLSGFGVGFSLFTVLSMMFMFYYFP